MSLSAIIIRHKYSPVSVFNVRFNHFMIGSTWKELLHLPNDVMLKCPSERVVSGKRGPSWKSCFIHIKSMKYIIKHNKSIKSSEGSITWWKSKWLCSFFPALKWNQYISVIGQWSMIPFYMKISGNGLLMDYNSMKITV